MHNLTVRASSRYAWQIEIEKQKFPSLAGSATFLSAKALSRFNVKTFM